MHVRSQSLNSRWRTHASLLLIPASRGGGRSGETRWYSSSRPCMGSNASVESGTIQTFEQDWEECFADPLQWWDNRYHKMNPKSPDFRHKVTKNELWVDDWSTPPWVKAMLKLMELSKLSSHGGHRTSGSRGIARPKRLSKGKFGSRNTFPTSAVASQQDVRGGAGSVCMQSETTTSEAIDLLKMRLQQGNAIDSFTYVQLLKRCLEQEDLTAVKQVHECSIESGMQQNIYVATNLLKGYIRCGSLQDARRVFDELVEKDVISWNVMIGGYAQHCRAQDAMEVFDRMRQEGVQANTVTYLSILKACVSPSALRWGKTAHMYIRHGGLESDVRVGTALLKMYTKCGSIEEARNTFDKLAIRNIISWTVMIGAYAENGCGEEAYRLLLRMKREDVNPTAITYLSILNASASAGALERVRVVHSHARGAGFESDVRVGNALVHMYAKCGSLKDARLAFDRMEERDVITWNAMIGGLAQHGRALEALELFLRMKQEGFQPCPITYLHILNASASAGALDWAREVHSHVREAGFESDLRVGNALVHMYAKCGSLDDARRAFDRMEGRDVITWTAMIGGLAERGRGREAFELFLRMIQEGFTPCAITYLSILNASASAGALDWVREVHNRARDAGLESDVRVGNALVHMYSKCGSVEDARMAFDRMEERDVITWSAMIGGLAQHGRGPEALDLFRNMIAAGVKPNEYSFVAVLSACSHTGLVHEGRRLFRAMSLDHGVDCSVVHWTCMVDILGRAGLLEEAKLLIDSMPVAPDVATWGALLGACRTYCNLELGEVAAKELFKLDPRDASTYVLLSNIYAAAEKWEEVALVRIIMQDRGVRKEPARSWIEVGNKIHDFVGGDTSHPETDEIYEELRRLGEIIKAEGYRPDTSLVLHDVDEKEKEFTLCSHSEKLAIAYGLIHTPRREPVRVYKNLRVCADCHAATKLISKATTREIVVRDANRFHHFKDGLCSCKDYW